MFNNSKNCLLTVTGNGTGPIYLYYTIVQGVDKKERTSEFRNVLQRCVLGSKSEFWSSRGVKLGFIAEFADSSNTGHWAILYTEFRSVKTSYCNIGNIKLTVLQHALILHHDHQTYAYSGSLIWVPTVSCFDVRQPNVTKKLNRQVDSLPGPGFWCEKNVCEKLLQKAVSNLSKNHAMLERRCWLKLPRNRPPPKTWYARATIARLGRGINRVNLATIHWTRRMTL